MSRIEPLRFSNCRGERLAGVLHHPSEMHPRCGVVVAHGMLSSKDSPKHRALCHAAAALGMIALRFDFAGRGASEGPPELLTVSREIEDLAAASSLVALRVAGPVALVGSSLGGTVALLHAAAAPREVAALVTIASPAHLPRQPREAWAAGRRSAERNLIELSPGVLISEQLFADARLHDVVASAARVRCPWLVVHGGRDEIVPADDARELAAANPLARLLVEPTADHRFSTTPTALWLIDQARGFLSSQVVQPLRRSPAGPILQHGSTDDRRL